MTKLVIGDAGRELAYDRIRQEVSLGQQAFIVCPLIEESEAMEAKNVEAEVRRLAQGPLRGLRIGMVHGRMSTKDKDAAMQLFAEGKMDVLVATTVVEVGVDVPKATVMLIESADRFGLAQLHQLRGRVGRSQFHSYCFLAISEDGNAHRLRIMEQTQDGFVVAEADLAQRGEGNVLGTQQSGEAMFKTARLDDLGLIAAAKEQAERLSSASPGFMAYPALRERIEAMRKSQHRE